MKNEETINAILNAKALGETKVLAKVEDLAALVDYMSDLKFSNNSLRRDRTELEKNLELALNGPEYTPLDTFV